MQSESMKIVSFIFIFLFQKGSMKITIRCSTKEYYSTV